LCINTQALVLIYQYSIGLLVSYSTHGKTQLYETDMTLLMITFTYNDPIILILVTLL